MTSNHRFAQGGNTGYRPDFTYPTNNEKRRPLDNPYIRRQLAFHAEIVKVAKDFRHLGRKGRVLPFTLGFDGPLTAAFMLFGEEIFLLMATDPEKAKRLLLFITEACIIRNQALYQHAG